MQAINLSQSDLDDSTPVYRIVSIRRFYELFDTKKNVLVRPKLWDDPFEHRMMQSTFQMPNGEKAILGFANDYFAQCWSLEHTSDALWRIYSAETETDGIRIKSTVGKVLKSLANEHEVRGSAFIGKVQYLKQDDLERRCKELGGKALDDTSGKAFAESLLWKRSAFSHEQEVRLVYSMARSDPQHGNLFRYSIDPHNLIDQVMLHPMLNTKEANRWKDRISRELKYSVEHIKHSQLYSEPQALTIPIRS